MFHLQLKLTVRQIYGFMRKVNLRNVDPAIDDPDASTWCMFMALLLG